MKINSRSVLGGALLATTLAFTGCGMMSTTSMWKSSNNLTAASEVPPNPSSGTGVVTTQLDKGTRVLTWTVTYSGLTGPVTAGHFHGPALPGSNAGVVVPFSGSMASPIQGSATLTEAQVVDLAAGKWYANLHTATNPGGEVRGQVTGN